MKKIFILFALFVVFNLAATDYIEYSHILNFYNEALDKEENLNSFLGKNVNWRGIILNIVRQEGFDIIEVDLDVAGRNPALSIKDVFFFIDDKIAERLDNYQALFFTGVIKKIAIENNLPLIEIENVKIKGLMK